MYLKEFLHFLTNGLLLLLIFALHFFLVDLVFQVVVKFEWQKFTLIILELLVIWN